MQIAVRILPLFLLAACSSAPHLDDQKIRPWSAQLESEYPDKKVVIAHYHKGDYDLYDLTARHSADFRSDTFNMVDELFHRFQFDVLLIESIPYSSGQSPQWFLREAKQGRTDKYIKGGESSYAVILADERKIPFFAGEPDHEDIYKALKQKGYSDLDVIAFYTVRQIPQWVRDHAESRNLIDREAPPFIRHYCQIFKIQICPILGDIQTWYKNKFGRSLSIDVQNEDLAPIAGTKIFTQQISADIGIIRDHFTLGIIQKLLHDYKRVAVIYGGSHFVTLRRSFDAAFGQPVFIESMPPREFKTQ